MENYKQELTSLKKELNSRIDAVIAKIEKPQFEVGKWYKINSDSKIVCCYKGANSGYGTGSSGYNWSDTLVMSDISLWTLASPKEVEEALTKECIKLGLVGGKKANNSSVNKLSFEDFKLPENGYFNYIDNELWWDGYDPIDSAKWLLFKDGIFATPIKNKTIDELVNDIICEYPMQNFSLDVFIKQYIIENKQEIIKALNNL